MCVYACLDGGSGVVAAVEEGGWTKVKGGAGLVVGRAGGAGCVCVCVCESG